ncbi:MAG: flagellar basal body L-ring protein FlgH [Pseudomonadota bacterium]|nr:flagellar basal body L-ring protein FlgH [Pseudomonadota bacterium]MED5443862.1 flagellar basal body L-ring protein FlgH [Pseudomonadota bacterium]
MRLFSLIAFAPFVLGGCVSAPPDFEPDFSPVPPVAEAVESAPSGSLFMSSRTAWFGEARASRVGDTVTILLQESTQSTRSANVSTSRESTNDFLSAGQVDILSAGSNFVNVPGMFDGSTSESTGSGNSGQSASLTGSITATVVEVLPNGNMVVQGEKILSLTEGSERVRVRGVIRPRDISQMNTVLSYRLANAQIRYEGRGDLARAVRPGWGTRFFNAAWPF